MDRLINAFSLVFVIGILSAGTIAQTSTTADDDDIQSWNDVTITIPVSKKVDLYFPFTFRFGGNMSNLQEGKTGAGVVIHPTSRFAITPFYSYIRTRSSSGVYRTENRLQLRLAYKFPTKGFGLSHRSQFEYRIRSSGNTWRYRPSVTIEKDLPKSIAPDLKLFVTEEPFYDSASGRFSRNRISFGLTKTLTKSLSVDLYYLHQADNFSNPGTVNVIGTSWKIKL